MSDSETDMDTGQDSQPIREVRNVQEILAFLKERNPDISTYEYDGRICIKFQDFYMAICGVKETAARKAKGRLMDKYPDLCSRLIISKQITSKFIQ